MRGAAFATPSTQPRMDFPPFPGFTPAAFEFLRNLKVHNRREWFKPRKEVYEDELQWPLRCLVQEVAAEAQRRGLPLAGDPQRSLFRIYRDTRFSNNKAPYKTHVSAYLSPTGDKDAQGGVYVHVEPDKCFLAAGYWQPESPLLRRWRSHMAAAPDAFLALTDALEAHGLTFGTDDTLKRLPRGFEQHADGPLAEAIRLKSFVVSRAVPDEVTMTPGFTEHVLAFAAGVQPLARYGMQVERG